MNLYKEYNFNFDVDLLKKEVLSIISSYPGVKSFNPQKNKTWSLQYSKIPGYFNDIDKFTAGVDNQRLENEVTNWNEELENSYIKECVYKVHDNPSNTRIMLLNTGRCYPTHVDGYKSRYQIPVFSIPPFDYFAFPKNKIIFGMESGKAYWVNTHAYHSYVNGTSAPRINIIFNDAKEKLDLTPQQTLEHKNIKNTEKEHRDMINEVYNNG